MENSSSKLANIDLLFYKQKTDNNSSNMSKMLSTGSKNSDISLPLYMIEYIDSIRGRYPRSKFVLNLIKKALEVQEPNIKSKRFRYIISKYNLFWHKVNGSF